jgi:hypothetical protein
VKKFHHSIKNKGGKHPATPPSHSFGRGPLPEMHKASKFDHGQGPEDFAHMDLSVARTGMSQHPKQTVLNPGVKGRGVKNPYT